MFKLKFKQKMKPNFLLCLTLRRKTLEIHVRISRVTTKIERPSEKKKLESTIEGMLIKFK